MGPLEVGLTTSAAAFVVVVGEPEVVPKVVRTTPAGGVEVELLSEGDVASAAEGDSFAAVAAAVAVAPGVRTFAESAEAECETAVVGTLPAAAAPMFRILFLRPRNMLSLGGRLGQAQAQNENELANCKRSHY